MRALTYYVNVHVSMIQYRKRKENAIFGCCHSEMGGPVNVEPHGSACAARQSLDAPTHGYLGNGPSQHNLANQNIYTLGAWLTDTVTVT